MAATCSPARHCAAAPRFFLRLLALLLVATALAGCADEVSSPSGDPDADAGDGASDLDVRDTTSGGRCADGRVDPGEQCDPVAQPTYQCNAFGAGSGTALCTTDCALDLSQCSNPPDTCGDGAVDIGEACDGSALGGRTCAGQGFDGGVLACQANCQLDTSGCTGGAPGCGNNVRDSGEACDGADLGSSSCTTVGDFVSGTLACAADCTFDTSGCVQLCGNGTLDAGEACDDGNRVDDLSCSADCSAACGAGAAECSGTTSSYCSGGTVVTETCDPLIGETCGASGRCSSPCSPSALGRSYVGCDYFPTVTANLVDSRWTFAVAVSNTSTEAASVTVTRGDATVATATVASRSVAVIALPWVQELKGPSSLSVVPFPASIHLADGAYRLRSTRPVTVYQFNPLEYTSGGNCLNDNSRCTFSNDASLLLPTHVWGRDYRVAARHHFFDSSGFLAITAVEDGTTVTVSPSPNGSASFRTGVPGIGADGAGTVTLNSGDVVQVVTNAGGDPTGHLVVADKPVQVLGGHQCTYVPDDTAACDHLEESIFPLETLSPRYLVTAPMSPGGGGPKAQVVRIIATENDTTITYDPPQPDAPSTIAAAGGWFELSPRATDFFVTASSPVLVARYMQGQDTGASSGDPAMATAVNTSQFRDDYLFHAPTNYEESWVNITAPNGATVQLDGQAVTEWTPVGASGFSVARRELSNSGDGNHSVTASAPVGITVYGYGQYTSYWYPGGLNLEIIN